MSHRVGVCQSCQTRFQIPASFAPNRAKCRNCGGVVEIGPPPGAPGRRPDRGPGRAPEPPRRAPQPIVEKPASVMVAERAAPIAPAPKPQPVVAEPAIVVPARKGGLVRALLVAGIAAVVAIGLWSLFA